MDKYKNPKLKFYKNGMCEDSKKRLEIVGKIFDRIVAVQIKNYFNFFEIIINKTPNND